MTGSGSVKHVIRAARFPEDAPAVRALFQDYLDWIESILGESLSYQNTDAELSTLPGKYAEPGGRIWIGSVGGLASGCVAVRALPETSVYSQDQRGGCELKRLWVNQTARGSGLGSALLRAAIDWSSASGYTHMKLDSDPRLEAAMKLYLAAGFETAARYNDDPMPCTLYMALDLTQQ